MFHPFGVDRPESPMIEQISVPSGKWLNFGSLSRRVAMVLTALAFLSGCSTTREVLDVPAKPQKYAALVVDASNGKALFQFNSTAPRYPASLTKMMTLYLLFEALDSGRVTKSTQIPVSANAAARAADQDALPARRDHRRGFGDPRDRGQIGQRRGSGVRRISRRLRRGVCRHDDRQGAPARHAGTRFRNASGLPDAGQQTTARDMAVLGHGAALALSAAYPLFLRKGLHVSAAGWCAATTTCSAGCDGVDGIKTGYIRASGYNIVTSVRAGGRS